MALDEDFANRGRRCEEQIEVMRSLWTRESVSFEGTYHSLPGVGISPLPVQQPIPIWIGGQADVVLKRAALMADGWLPMDSPEVAAQRLEKFDRYCVEYARDRAAMDFPCTISLERNDFDWVEDQVERWKSLGASIIYLDAMNSGLKGPDEHIEVAGRFRSLFGN